MNTRANQAGSWITKQRILEAAVRCFNHTGVSNTRLQQIADEAGMSLGNMAYHFRTKELIVEAIWARILEAQHTLMAEFRVLPLFEDIERMFRSYFALQQAYPFFYQDTLEILRSYPQIAAAHRENRLNQIAQVGMMFQFNVSRGAFIPEYSPGQHQALAEICWNQLESWQYRQRLLQSPADDFEAFRKSPWMLLSTCFSDMGWSEFSQLNALILGKYF